MNLDFNNNIEKSNNISNEFSKELENSLNKKLIFSIDRFESNFAVCENKSTGELINIERSMLPENCKEGDIIKYENGVYIIDEEYTKNKKNEIKEMVNNLFKKKNT